MDSSQMGLVGGVYAGADGRMQQQNPIATALVPNAIPQTTAITTWQKTPIDPSDVPQKTPVSLLQECCTKKGMSPQYELLSTEGQVHEPTFVYRVTVNDKQATGQGKSKKVAKHLAAKGLLEQIVHANQYVEWTIPGRSHSEAMEYLQKLIPEPAARGEGRKKDGTDSGGEGDGPGVGKAMGNPIGRLQERCLRNRWPPPEYELISETGQPHDRTFVVTIKLGKCEQKSEARSKKTAKRLAAEKMLSFLENLPKKEGLDADEDGLVEEYGLPGDAYPLELEEELKSLRFSENDTTAANTTDTVEGSEDGTSTLTPPPVKEKGRRGDKSKGGIELAEAPRLLARIAEEHHFRVNYLDIEMRREDGQYQCLVQLSTMPVAVCYGNGRTRDEAQFSAAHNALYYLKIMMFKNGDKQ